MRAGASHMRLGHCANGSDGMTRAEREVMRLWDANSSMQQIARAMPMRLDRVRSIVSNFHDTGEHGRAAANVASGTAALAAAIARAKQVSHQPTGEHNG